MSQHGASNAEGQLAPPIGQVYTLPEIEATRTDALGQTLKELRELRDGMLHQDERSHAGLLLAQITLVLERIEHGIPSDREAFSAVLRAAELTKPAVAAVEVTV